MGSNLIRETQTTFIGGGGRPYELKENDYHYSSIYLDWMKVYDVEQVNSIVPGVKFNEKPNMRPRHENYPSVEVWLRKKGHTNYFKYGAFSYDSTGKPVFTPEPGYTPVYTYWCKQSD